MKSDRWIHVGIHRSIKRVHADISILNVCPCGGKKIIMQEMGKDLMTNHIMTARNTRSRHLGWTGF